MARCWETIGPKIGFAGIVAAGILSMSGCGDRSQQIVLISVDTLRRDHITPYGYDRETSPHIGKLAREGVVFDNALVAHTNTAPSHASMLTGLYPPSHGIVRQLMKLDEDVYTLAQILGTEGFVSAGFVSGYPLRGDRTELDRGFDHYADSVGYRIPGEVTLDRFAQWLADQTVQHEKLFVFFHLYDPHDPYEAPEPFDGHFLPKGGTYPFSPKHATEELPPYKALRNSVNAGTAKPGVAEELVRRYDQAIAYADDNVGRFIELLKEHHYWDDAFVILASDHGETLVDRDVAFTHGGRAYDEQIRVPLIMRFPGGRHAGKRVAAPVHHVDILPTVLDWLNLPAPDRLQGQSLLPFIDPPWFGDESDSARPLVSLARPEPRRNPELRSQMVKEGLISSVRSWPWKLIASPTKAGEIYQLFNLEQDPGEHEDLAVQEPEIVNLLIEELTRWRERTGARSERSAPELSDEDEDALRVLGYIE